MKPRLVKFTCPACNARLAVPEAMAGMEDDCPKCAARIRAPLPDPEPAPVADPKPASPAEATPGKSRHSILDAVLHAEEPATTAPRQTRSPEKTEASKAREASRSALFDEFLSAAPQPPAMDATAKAPPAKSPKSRLNQPDAAKPAGAPETEPPAPTQLATPPVPKSAPAATPVTPTLREIVSAPESKPVAPPPEPVKEWQPSPSISEPTEANKPDIGMGEMFAEHSGSPSPSLARHELPPLGVGLMQVEDRPRQQELRRRRRAVVTGIILFLLFDAVVLCWIFRRPILEWWNDRRAVAVAQRAAPQPSRNPGAPEPPLKTAATPAATTAGKDLNRSPASTPSIEPEKSVPPLIPKAPLHATIAEATAPADLRSEPPFTAVNLGAQPASSPREIGDVPGKREFSAAQIGPPLVPSPAASDSPNAPVMTPAAKDLLSTLDVPLLAAPKPDESTAVAAKDDLKAKMETAPPPSPPADAAIPEGAGKPPSPDPAQGLTATVEGEVPPAPARIVEKGIIPAARPALAALKNFLAAPTWQERVRWVQKPETVKAAMERHYQKHSDGSINVARIDFIERYPARNGNPPYSMFEVSGGDLKRTLLVLVEERSKADFRVDWEAFAEFKDRLLQEFLGKAGSPPGKFRVMIRRTHSFDKSVPDLDRKDSFELTQPGLDSTGLVYAVKGATVARALSQRLGWDESIPATVQLAWHSEGNRSWVEVAAIPAFSWRG